MADVCSLPNEELISRKKLFSKLAKEYPIKKLDKRNGKYCVIFQYSDVLSQKINHLIELEENCCPSIKFSSAKNDDNLVVEILPSHDDAEKFLDKFVEEFKNVSSRPYLGFLKKFSASAIIALIACEGPKLLVFLGVAAVSLDFAFKWKVTILSSLFILITYWSVKWLAHKN